MLPYFIANIEIYEFPSLFIVISQALRALCWALCGTTFYRLWTAVYKSCSAFSLHLAASIVYLKLQEFIKLSIRQSLLAFVGFASKFNECFWKKYRSAKVQRRPEEFHQIPLKCPLRWGTPSYCPPSVIIQQTARQRVGMPGLPLNHQLHGLWMDCVLVLHHLVVVWANYKRLSLNIDLFFCFLTQWQWCCSWLVSLLLWIILPMRTKQQVTKWPFKRLFCKSPTSGHQMKETKNKDPYLHLIIYLSKVNAWCLIKIH